MSAPRLRSGATVYGTDGAAFVLDKEIGRGGEGAVWSVQGDQRFAAKFYHKGIAAEHVRKLEVMCRLKSESLLKIAAWPTSTLRLNRAGQSEGLLMPRILGYQPAHLLYSPKSVIDHLKSSFSELLPVGKPDDIIRAAGVSHPSIINTATDKVLRRRRERVGCPGR